MRSWIVNLFTRDSLMERGTQHPFTLMLLLTMAIAQSTIYVAEFSNIPLSHMVAFDARMIHVPSFFFPITHYAPLVSGGPEFGAGFSPLDFSASLVLWLLCGVALLSGGPVVESYLGTLKTSVAFVASCGLHVALALALPDAIAYSTMAFSTFLLVLSVLVHLEQRDSTREPENDFRLALLLFLFAFAGLTAGFMPDPSYHGLMPAIAAGPALALGAFVLNRKLQMREVNKAGQGHVGSLYFVDEFDLLTRDEIQARMDRLLAKISSNGMNSLAPDERRFLANASGRLKAAEPKQPSR